MSEDVVEQTAREIQHMAVLKLLAPHHSVLDTNPPLTDEEERVVYTQALQAANFLSRARRIASAECTHESDPSQAFSPTPRRWGRSTRLDANDQNKV